MFHHITRGCRGPPVLVGGQYRALASEPWRCGPCGCGRLSLLRAEAAGCGLLGLPRPTLRFSGMTDASFKGVTSVLHTNNLLAHTVETLAFTVHFPLRGRCWGNPWASSRC